MLTASMQKLRITLPTFDGPLDLLLHLIRANKVPIYDIPIAEITRQYVDYLALWEALDLSVAGEYLLMAATLMEIKSRMLLPQPPLANSEEEEDPRSELVQRLLEYQKYQKMAEMLRSREEQRLSLFFRMTQKNPEDGCFPIEKGVMEAAVLLGMLRKALAKVGAEQEPMPSLIPRRRIGLRRKMTEILRKLNLHPEGLSFEALCVQPLCRFDIVLTFLALLELLRQGKAHAEQVQPLGEITLFPITGKQAFVV
jgi:segregation and condensation protein A